MERVWSTSRRGFSARSILTFVLTVFITALLWVTFGSHTTTHALDDTTATWKGESLIYHGHQYNANTDAAKGNSLDLPVGTHYYSYTPDNDGTTGTQAKTVKAFVIYFTPGTDPPKATSAMLVTYDYSPSKGYSNPSGKETIAITIKGTEDSYRSCSVEGIGWIICPVTVFLANGMDFIFQQVSTFMAVHPVTVNDSTSSLFIAWNIMRTIANVAFIIVFLIIIYSQLTNAAVSNYGIKKLLPRLLVAALLVNLSYIICSIAVDISNIFGYSLQQIFVDIRKNTFSITNDTWSNTTTAWSTVTALVLSGAGIGVLAYNPAVLYLLIPVLVGALLTILVVLLILAARQAIIIILIIIAPLAFVAYLLPNTEQWFKKWRELFMTMLIFFPAFSLVFGGSQLASSIILQNATTMMMIVVGLAVQIAPLIITPIILKFSGSLLGKIAGLVNDPKKGVLDRTKGWAQSRVDRGKARAYANASTKNPFRKVAQGFAYTNRQVKKDTEKYQAQSEDWMTKKDVTSRKGQAIEVETALAKLRTEERTNDFGQAMQELRAGNESGLTRLRMQEGASFSESIQSKMSGDSIQTIRTRRYETRDAEGNKLDATLKTTSKFAKIALAYANDAQELDVNARAIQSATAIAQNAQVTEYAKRIENSAKDPAFTALKVRAGGIAGERGQAGALAAAFKAQAEAHNTAVANANSIMSHYNYSDDVIVKLAQGDASLSPDFDRVSDALREAAITKVASGANAGAILELMKNIDINTSDENQDFRQAFADALIANGAKPKFAGAGIIAEIKQGTITKTGEDRINDFIVQTAQSDKFGSAETLVTQDRDYLNALAKTLGDTNSAKAIDNDKKATILNAIDTIRNNPLYSGKVGERKEALDLIEKQLRDQTGIRPTNPNTTPGDGTGSGPGGFVLPDDPK